MRSILRSSLRVQKSLHVAKAARAVGGVDLNNGLVAAWNFNGDYADASGNGYTLTGVNSPTFGAGKIGQALYLDRASSQYAKIANASAGVLKGSYASFTNGLTAASWMYPTSFETSFDRQSIIASGDGQYGSGTTEGWMLGVANSGVLTWYGKSALIATHTTTLTLNAWNFVGLRLTSGGVMTLIVGNSNEDTDFGESNAFDASTADFNLGNANNGSVFAGAFDGRIGATAFWNRALTDDEITELYNAGAGKEAPY